MNMYCLSEVPGAASQLGFTCPSKLYQQQTHHGSALPSDHPRCSSPQLSVDELDYLVNHPGEGELSFFPFYTSIGR